MARFLVAAVLTTLACTCLALPHSEISDFAVSIREIGDFQKPEVQDGAPLEMIHPEADAGNLKFFFFPFNFWNGFKPLPWIPLPGLQLPTTKAPEKGDDDKGDEEEKDKDKEDDGDDKEKEEEAETEE